jgi:hypothetical protein
VKFDKYQNIDLFFHQNFFSFSIKYINPKLIKANAAKMEYGYQSSK